jgi:hypothetical protein
MSVGGYEHRQNMLRRLTGLQQDGKAELIERPPLVDIAMPDRIGTCYGGIQVEEDVNEEGAFNFTITLGPANSLKLIDFLAELPDEPEEDQ